MDTIELILTIVVAISGVGLFTYSTYLLRLAKKLEKQSNPFAFEIELDIEEILVSEKTFAKKEMKSQKAIQIEFQLAECESVY